jgi:hypothetical protein
VKKCIKRNAKSLPKGRGFFYGRKALNFLLNTYFYVEREKDINLSSRRVL